MTWGERAECKKKIYDPEMWVPSGGTTRPAKVQEAIRICRKHCEIRRQCAQHARDTGQTFGVWGGVLGYGTNPSQRATALLKAVAEGVA